MTLCFAGQPVDSGRACSAGGAGGEGAGRAAGKGGVAQQVRTGAAAAPSRAVALPHGPGVLSLASSAWRALFYRRSRTGCWAIPLAGPPARRGVDDASDQVFVCERVCTSNRLQRRMGGLAKVRRILLPALGF